MEEHMRKQRNTVPLDYSLCTMTVTVYHREGLTRRVIRGVHYEFTHAGTVTAGMAARQGNFLLVIPGEDPIAVGDKVVLGEGPAIERWGELNPADTPTLGVVASVKPRFFRGTPCHTEARGS